ncbi:D-amino-acid transaminase [Roseobacter sp. HKCCA0434]|uniref:D-amino-acid transaminase n=1 Tax=Roseobacter sp. HKCCA0434 TaxID=3079297 RepID=UPI0029058FC7|nr:D-amino-acid transaminase [Roseobacter sp. HKCCA0434]
MARIVYVDGAYVPEAEAKVSVFDRGFLFADGVYEVTSVIDGKLVDFAGHLTRLARSLSELQIPAPVSDAELEAIHRELVTRNELTEGLIYLQVTRGPADRDFVWLDDPTPTLVLFTQEKALIDSPLAARGLSVALMPDIRWQRRDIKTVQLLAPSMAKMAARAEGADDAWMVEDGHVTEGTSNNAWIVTADGAIVTRHLSNSILHGITRATVRDIAADLGLSVEERAFTPDEARAAAEAFVTAATSFVTPVVKIDGQQLGDGKPGPVATRLREAYIEQARRLAV